MKSARHFLFSLLFLWSAIPTLSAQEDDRLSLLGEDESTELVRNAFKSPRVINGHSMEMLRAGVLDFRILHRFGPVNQGFYDLFGLDQASMRIGFDYALTEGFTLGVGRSTAKKELDAFAKFRILGQSAGAKPFPVSLIWVSGITNNGLKTPFSAVEANATRRLAYYHELIIGRKFSEAFSLQISPTVVHQNFVENELAPNDLVALGIGGRLKLSKRIAFVWDYGLALNRYPEDASLNPLSVGLDIETGGHVFQLHFSNSTGMNERAFLADPNGDFFDGDIRFGFNLSRVFQIAKKP